ncbi:MAG: MarR family transcriptional regulator [Lachnospiraceae bacterium]|nr:MarR family transcriptional regulator [Lachnospiraceae bacterium]
MEPFDWMEMMEKMQEIRLFSSLHIRGKREGAASPQELDVLSRILLSDEPLTPLDLAALTGLSKSAVSRLIERLEKKRFINKQYNKKDKRSYTLYATPLGNEELDLACQHYLEPVYKLRRTIGEERFQQLTALIEEANDMLQKEAEQ